MTTTPASTPAARPSALERTFTLAAPLLMVVGIALAALGTVAGVIAAFLAALLLATVAVVSTRRRAATLPRALSVRATAIAIGVGAFGVTTTGTALREAPLDGPMLVVLALMAAIVTVGGLLVIRR